MLLRAALGILLCFPLVVSLAHAQNSDKQPGDKQPGDKLKALIVDGQNNHRNWPETTQMMKQYLADTGRFTVEVATTAPQGADANFKPEFKRFLFDNDRKASRPAQTPL